MLATSCAVIARNVPASSASHAARRSAAVWQTALSGHLLIALNNRLMLCVAKASVQWPSPWLAIRATARSQRRLSVFFENALASKANCLPLSRGKRTGASTWPAIQATASMAAGRVGYLLRRLPRLLNCGQGAPSNQSVLNR